jgi:hypothetical protein
MDDGVTGTRSASMTRSVTATLNYMAPDPACNRLYVANGGHMTTTRYAPAAIEIHDGRPHLSEFSLDALSRLLLLTYTPVLIVTEAIYPFTSCPVSVAAGRVL